MDTLGLAQVQWAAMLVERFEASPDAAAIFDGIQREPGAFLMEDVHARAAVVGANPMFMLTAKDGVITRAVGGISRTLPGHDALRVLEEQMTAFQADKVDWTVPFSGGAVGWLSYDLGRSLEVLPSIAREDLPTPDLCMGFYDSALCIDPGGQTCAAVSWSGDRSAVRRWKELARAAPESDPSAEVPPVLCPGDPVEIDSNFTRRGYIEAIDRIRGYIEAGDIYQISLSQRFRAPLRSSPWGLYRALRRINPAPKSFYMSCGSLALASASPEVFLAYDPRSRIAVTKPIKGTRPRGRNTAEDAALAAELAASAKDRAENLMIVDMERNDLGRVAEYGSVRVNELWRIEKHPNVFQMVSTVEARLAREYGPVDLVRACFPGGSITGAPKVRAMEIIEELEPHRRGIYTGSAGFLDFRGRLDLSIVIRSFVISNGEAFFSAGGGIVIDSEPEREYQETLDKISGLRAALCESEVTG